MVLSQTFENLCDGQSQVKISRIANWGILVFLLHPFHATGLFLYPLKMPKKNMFSDVFRGVKTTSVMKMVTEPNTNTKKTQNVNIKIKQIWRNFFQVKTQIVIKRNESYKVLLLSFFWLWVGWTCFFFHSISSMQWHIKNQQQGRISLFKVSDQDMWTPSFSHYMETSQLIQATDRFLYNRELCGRSTLTNSAWL